MLTMRHYAWAFVLITFFGVEEVRSQELSPSDAFNRMLSVVIKASHEIASTGKSDQFASVDVSVRWPDVRVGFPKEERPVQISSFLDSDDIFFLDKKIVRSNLNFVSPESYCKAIDRSRESGNGNFGNYQPVPIVITTQRWSFTYSDILSCSDNHVDVLRGIFKPPFIEIPVALSGIILLTSEKNTLPRWITRQHIAVASLASLPKGAEEMFSPRGHVTVSKECVPNTQQPTLSELQQAINTAECTTIDSFGRRKVGSYPRRWIPEDLSSYHKSSPERDLSSLLFFFEGKPNDVRNWAYIDKGLKSMPISISIFDDRHNTGTPFYDGSALEFLCKTGVYPDNYNTAFSWGELFRIYRAVRDCNWRSEASFLTGDSFLRDKDAVALGSFGTYMRIMKQDKFLARSYIPWSTERSGSSSGFYSDWKNDILSGNYPFMDIVWMYIDPATLTERNVREFVVSIMNGETSASYNGSLALWGWLKDVH